jgi:hypothetical protein
MKNDPDEDGTHIRVMPSPKARLNETSLLFRAVFLLVLGNAVWFLWAHRFVPTADFPEREYQGMILSRFIRGVPPEAYSIQLYPVPHSLTAVLGALFDLILSPELSGKVILTIAVIAFAMASTYLLKSLGASERHPLMFVPLAFIFDSKFFWGEIDYYLGFAAFCAFAGFMLSRRNEPARIRGWLVFLVLCLVFEIHLVPYICCGLVCVAIAATRRDRGSLRKLLLPVIASGFLLVWYATERMASRLPADATFWKPWTADSLVRNFIGRFSIFHIFCPWYDYDSPLFKAAALANIAVLLSVMSLWFFCVLRWRLSRRDDKDVVVAVAFMLIGYLSADMVTGADLGERFLFPATWMAIAWFAPRWNPRLPRARLVTTILVALISLN